MKFLINMLVVILNGAMLLMGAIAAHIHNTNGVYQDGPHKGQPVEFNVVLFFVFAGICWAGTMYLFFQATDKRN